MKTIILNLIKSNKDSFVQIIKAKHSLFYNEINEKFSGGSFSEKIYQWLNYESGVNCGICVECKSSTKFLNIKDGYRKYCSSKCANVSTASVRSIKMTHVEKDINIWEQKKCELCNEDFWAYKKRNGRFCSNKCSALFTANNKERLEKIKCTKLKVYGNETYVNPEKAKQTCLEKYGVDNASKAKEVIVKIQQVNLERYGKKWSWQSESVKEKIKQTNLLRYGVENPSQSSHIKENKIQSYLKQYGVKNPFQNLTIKEDIKAHYKEKFGVEYPTQIEEVRNKIAEIVRKNNYKLLCSSKRVLDNIEVLFTVDEYKGSSSEFLYSVKCKKCGNVFQDHFDGNGHPRCLICYPNIAGFSYAEKEIVSYIHSIVLREEIIEKDRSVLGNRELDIYIPSKALAIEYNGLFWHSESNGKKSKLYHLDKLERCQSKGIRLITIFEDEWENNRDIVQVRLQHILNLSTNKIYARQCSIQVVTSKLANAFLNKNHIQGGCSSLVNLGLFDENSILVAIMTFGKPRLSLGRSVSMPGEYELLRYATSKVVVGGASKLFTHFIRIHSPVKIFSYSDKRWSTGKMYEKLGFLFKKETKPNYWYFKPGYAIRYHRFGFRKNILNEKLDIFDPELTEWENMQLNGYDRIWDCGNSKYEWNSQPFCGKESLPLGKGGIATI